MSAPKMIDYEIPVKVMGNCTCITIEPIDARDSRERGSSERTSRTSSSGSCERIELKGRSSLKINLIPEHDLIIQTTLHHSEEPYPVLKTLEFVHVVDWTHLNSRTVEVKLRSDQIKHLTMMISNLNPHGYIQLDYVPIRG